MRDEINLTVAFDKPHWRVARDGHVVASLRRATSARARARELAARMVKSGQTVTITCFNRDGSQAGETTVRPPSARARTTLREIGV